MPIKPELPIVAASASEPWFAGSLALAGTPIKAMRLSAAGPAKAEVSRYPAQST